jgi:hypothetical protein
METEAAGIDAPARNHGHHSHASYLPWRNQHMRLPTLSVLAIATAASGLLAGCSGSPQMTSAEPTALTAPQSHASAYRPMVTRSGALSVWPDNFTPRPLRAGRLSPPPPGVAKGNVAVAQFGATSVLWFPKNNRKNQPPTVCQPASSTNGIGVDPEGNLWVPDGRADTTTEYAPHCGAAKLTIPDPTGEPAAIGFDSKGNVYIMNLHNTSGPPTVGIYNSSGVETGTLTDPSFEVPFGVGTDSHDNVYVSNLTSSNVGNIVEFPGGAMPGTVLGVSLGLPGSPVFDSKDNLIITDWLALTLDVFAPPYDGAPTTSPIKGSSIWCPLGKSQKRIFCGDADNGSIDVFAYPGGRYLYSYTGGLSGSELVTGVAPSPPAAF